jgi:hypothetical protein
MGGSLLSLLGKDKEGIGIVNQGEMELTEPLGGSWKSISQIHAFDIFRVLPFF